MRGGQLRKAQMLAGAVIVGVRRFSVFRAVARKSAAQSIAEMPAARKSCYHCGNHRPALRWASVCSLKGSGGRCTDRPRSFCMAQSAATVFRPRYPGRGMQTASLFYHFILHLTFDSFQLSYVSRSFSLKKRVESPFVMQASNGSCNDDNPAGNRQVKGTSAYR